MTEFLTGFGREMTYSVDNSSTIALGINLNLQNKPELAKIVPGKIAWRFIAKLIFLLIFWFAIFSAPVPLEFVTIRSFVWQDSQPFEACLRPLWQKYLYIVLCFQ